MIDRNLGPGIAADVTIVDDLVYVAFGTQSPMALMLVTLTLDGIEIRRAPLAFGFDQSFPRFSGPWLVYRQNESQGYRALAWNLQTGQTWPFTAAGGTFGLTISADLKLAAYEWQQHGQPWRIWLGSLTGGMSAETQMEGAPDGLDTISAAPPDLHVSLRKDTRGDVTGIWYPVKAGDLTVGELRDEPGRPNGGIGVELAGDLLRVALGGQNTPTPRCAVAGDTHAIVCWGSTVRLLLATEAQLRALPPVESTPAPEPPNPTPVPPDPPEPTPEPPQPIPVPPVLPYAHHQELARMDTKIVALRGPGGKYGRADGPNTGPWGGLNKGWRGLVWDGAHPDDAYRFELTKPDAKHKLVHVQTRGLFGADPTDSHLDKQFYLKPDEHDRGWGESPVVYDGNVSGVIAGWVEFDIDPALGKFVSCGFAVEVLS